MIDCLLIHLPILPVNLEYWLSVQVLALTELYATSFNWNLIYRPGLQRHRREEGAAMLETSIMHHLFCTSAMSLTGCSLHCTIEMPFSMKLSKPTHISLDQPFSKLRSVVRSLLTFHEPMDFILSELAIRNSFLGFIYLFKLLGLHISYIWVKKQLTVKNKYSSNSNST